MIPVTCSITVTSEHPLTHNTGHVSFFRAITTWQWHSNNPQNQMFFTVTNYCCNLSNVSGCVESLIKYRIIELERNMYVFLFRLMYSEWMSAIRMTRRSLFHANLVDIGDWHTSLWPCSRWSWLKGGKQLRHSPLFQALGSPSTMASTAAEGTQPLGGMRRGGWIKREKYSFIFKHH